MTTPDEPSSIHGKRVRKGKGFESLRREMLQDPRLSFKALGILAYLLSLPDTWKTNAERLGKLRPGRESQYAVRSGLRELEAAGYLRRERRSGVGGKLEWTWLYTDDPSTLTMERLSTDGADQQKQDVGAGGSIDGLSTDGSSTDIEIQDHTGSTRDAEGSRHSEATASPSTWPLTDEDQDIARSCAPSPRQRVEDAAPHQDPPNHADNPYVISAETLALIGQGEKICRLFDFLHAAVPGGLEPSELHAVESMLEREYHWRKIMGWVGKDRGYDREYTQALIDRAAGSNWDLSAAFDLGPNEVLAW